jgi:HEAT repeat protein
MPVLMVEAVPALPRETHQDEGAPASPPESPANPPTNDAPSESHLKLLTSLRDTIVRARESMDSRRTAAQLLVAQELPEARTHVVDLLGHGDPEVRRLVCVTLAEALPKSSAALDPPCVEPLILLLRDDRPEVRSAAARALAFAQDGGVAKKLGALAASTDVAAEVRRAAVDALAPNVDRLEVMETLVDLLGGGSDAIRGDVVAVLESATGERFGEDAERWRAWVQARSLRWNEDRLRHYRERMRSVQQTLTQRTEEWRVREEQLRGRMVEFQREYFRTLPVEQREKVLVSWLGDSLVDVRRTALLIVTVLIGDEGYRPGSEMLTALLRSLSDTVPEVRLETLRIVQNLPAPSVGEAVLERLSQETDATVRQGLLRALGPLGGERAVPVLITELASPGAHELCVQEAASALGQVAARVRDRSTLAAAVEPLGTRYAAAAGNPPLRSALLAGMAGVADASFAEAFRETLSSDDANLLRPALRGLVAVGEVASPARFRELTGHADVAVRLAAVEAVGRFGKDDADAQCLLVRLASEVEPSDAVRAGAWTALRGILRKRPISEQIAWADRFRDDKGSIVRYLTELEQQLSAPGTDADHLALVRERLVAELENTSRRGEAVPYLSSLFSAARERGDAEAFPWGLRLLTATVTARTDQSFGSVLGQLVALVRSEEELARLVATVTQVFDSPEVAGDTDRARVLIEEVARVPHDDLGPRWRDLVERLQGRFPASPAPTDPDASTPDPSPAGPSG